MTRTKSCAVCGQQTDMHNTAEYFPGSDRVMCEGCSEELMWDHDAQCRMAVEEEYAEGL